MAPVDTPLGTGYRSKSETVRRYRVCRGSCRGVNKALAILGALRCGVVDVLIIDDMLPERYWKWHSDDIYL